MTVTADPIHSTPVAEAIDALRHKDPRSTTLERFRLSAEADEQVEGMPQPLQLGRGLNHLLDRISVPVASHDLLLGRIAEEVPDEEGERSFHDITQRWQGDGKPPWMSDTGHECFAWERLLQLGLPGLQHVAEEKLRGLREGETTRRDWLSGAVLVYESLRRYARRYADAGRKAGLAEAADCCLAVADRPPKTFAEALQLMWLVGHVYCTMVARNPTLTFGRMDELLLGFYRRDLADGRLTREQAGDLIEDFYCKTNLILGRGEHQMGGGQKDTGWVRNLSYDSPLYVVLGGTWPDGSGATGELTELFLERVVPRFENPVIVLRYTRDLPEPVWRLACDRMRANASTMVYSDHAVIPAMIHAGIDERDAVTYTMHGCNWPDVPGVQRSVLYPWIWLPRQFLCAFVGEEGEPSPALHDMDSLYERFAEFVRRDVRRICDQLRAERREWDAKAPGTLRVDDCFLDGPIDRVRSWRLGGVRYTSITIPICSIATAADCFAAVDALVFRRKAVSLADLQEAVRSDFDRAEPLRQQCLNAPKFGQDDDAADEHAVRVLDTVLREIDEACRLGTDEEMIVFRCLETDTTHIRNGADIGATPDGRRAGEPTSENTSPYPGSCTRGLTAMFRSIAKLPLNRISSGALNVRISPSMVKGEEGLAKLASLLRTYFNLGGLQAQLSICDTDELRAAQQNPERYRDLMVRITGYSAAFVDMSEKGQNEIIRREEMTQ